MAQLNPSLNPTQDPSYIGYSRATEPNNAFKELFKGIGDTFSKTVEGADLVVKRNIDDEIYRQVDAKRNARTSELETMAGVGAPLDVVAAGANPTYLPQDVQNLPDSLALMKGARANGKMSQTEYYGQLNSVAKEMRNRYPGYREYIDKQIAEVTGVNPANARVNSLMQDINALTADAKGEHQKIEGWVRSKSKIPNIDKAYEEFLRTGDKMKLFKHVSDWEVKDTLLKRQKLEWEVETGDVNAKKRVATQLAHSEIAVSVAAKTESIAMEGGVDTVAGVAKWATEVSTGVRPRPPTEVFIQQAVKLAAHRNNIFREKMLEWSKPNPRAGGRTIIEDLGGAGEAAKILNDNLAGIDTLIKQLHDGNVAQSGVTHMIAQGVAHDEKYKLFKNPNVTIRQVAVMSDLTKDWGPTWQQKFFNNILQAGAIEGFQGYLANDFLKAGTQPDMYKGGQPFTLKNAIETVNSTTGGPAVLGDDKASRIYQAYFGLTELISDPNASAKDKYNLIRYAFDPSNQGLIGQFYREGTGPAQPGQLAPKTPGRYSVYRRLFNEKNVDIIHNVAKTEGDLILWENTKRLATDEFTTHLFNKDIHDLNSIQTYGTYRVEYDPKNVRFEVKRVEFDDTPEGRAARRVSGGTDAVKERNIQRAEVIVNRLNNGLQPLGYIYKKDNEEVGGVILGHMVRTGYKPLKGTAAGDIMQSITKQEMAKRAKEVSPDDPFKPATQ